MMKKRITAIASVFIAAALTACGASEKPAEAPAADTSAVSETEAATVSDTQTEAQTEATPADTTAAEITATEEITEAENEQVPDRDYEMIYAPVIDRFVDIINKGADNEDDYDGGMAIAEIARYNTPSENLDIIGYDIRDISGDGVPELIFGTSSDEDAANYNTIFSVFTCDGDIPVFSFEGWSRNSYTYLDDGSFFYRGSGRAMTSGFGKYHISKDGKSLECDDMYFYDGMDDAMGIILYYHNTTGEWDKENSEILGSDEDAYFAFSEALEARTADPGLIPLSSYVLEKDPASADNSVTADWLTDANVLSNCRMYSFGEAPTGQIIISTNGRVSSFKILSLTFTDVDENGKIMFDTKKEAAEDVLEKDCPVVLKLEFAGEIPNFGFSFTDENGNEKRFAIGVSGKDGTIDLIEF